MLLNRNRVTCAALLGVCLAGCRANDSSLSAPVVLSQPRSMDYVNATAFYVDPAMQARTWPVTPAIYPNFSTTTGSAKFQLVPEHNLDGNVRAALGPPIFLLNMLLLPVWVVQTPPWVLVESTSLYLPPTATGNPPLIPLSKTDFSGGPLGSAYTTASGRSAVAHVH